MMEQIAIANVTKKSDLHVPYIKSSAGTIVLILFFRGKQEIILRRIVKFITFAESKNGVPYNNGLRSYP